MSHVTLRNSYKTLSDRLNLFPQGAPPTELLFRILEVLFTKDEAALVALLPIRPFNAGAAAKASRSFSRRGLFSGTKSFFAASASYSILSVK